MSQLPWGGKPDSPTDEPSGTNQPGQGADAGPEADVDRCDCVCPNYGQQPWLPPGDGGGPGGDPDYEGTYYVLKRCRDNADQPAWVQTNEFNAGDVLLIEVRGTATCFYVDSVEVAAGTVQLTNVVRPSDVTEDYATCAACRAISDPDPPEPPVLPTSYAQLAFCSDDTLAPLWTPVEVFGQPVAEDLTKIYEIDSTCYYISNNIQPTPGGPLMPVFAATVHNDCVTCACDIGAGTEYNAGAGGLDLKSTYASTKMPNRKCYELWVYPSATHNGTTYSVSGDDRIRTTKITKVGSERDAYDAPLHTDWSVATDSGTLPLLSNRPMTYNGVAGGSIGGYEDLGAVDYTLTAQNLLDVYATVAADYAGTMPAISEAHTLILYVERQGLNPAGATPLDPDHGKIVMLAAHIVCDE